MSLVDAGVNGSVTSIASVSGGSLTNGVVGQNLEFRDTTRAEFRERVAKPLTSQIANRGTLFRPLASKLYLALLVVVFLLIVAPFVVLPGPWYAQLAASLVVLTLWGWLFGLRGRVCAHAFQATLFSPSGTPTRLRALKRKLDHVICATELRSAEQIYFAGDFIYSYWFGRGGPAELPLARAVQASAAFPGGFPPARLPTKTHHFCDAPSGRGGPPKPPSKLVMSDGGVYDNMGDQWARGLARRLDRWKELGDGRAAPERLVVVNASARVEWSPFRTRVLPLLNEVAALIRVNNVMYVNTTNVRRQDIVASFDPYHPDEAGELPGALIQIAQSPFVVAKAFAGGYGAPAERAKAVIQALGAENEKEWAKIARDNSAVETTLGKLGPKVAARLVHQGYVVTMCNLHVIFGEDFPLVDPIPSREEFDELAS